MNRDTSVTTSYTTGMTISMDAVSMKLFLTNLAMSTIVQIRELTFVKRFGYIEVETHLPHYDSLLEEYCAGVPFAVLTSSINQNIEILYQFVQDCVENDTKRGLYLLHDRSRQDRPFWELILQALDEYTQFLKVYQNLKNNSSFSSANDYTGYSQKFRKLMER